MKLAPLAVLTFAWTVSASAQQPGVLVFSPDVAGIEKTDAVTSSRFLTQPDYPVDYLFTVRPTIVYRSGRVDEGRAPVGVHCYELGTGASLAGCIITVTAQRVANSGGHQHNNPLGPDGEMVPTGGARGTGSATITGTSDANGNFIFDCIAPEPSGWRCAV